MTLPTIKGLEKEIISDILCNTENVKWVEAKRVADNIIARVNAVIDEHIKKHNDIGMGVCVKALQSLKGDEVK